MSTHNFCQMHFLMGPYHVFSNGGHKHFHSMVDDFVNADIFDAPIKETISNLSQITILIHKHKRFTNYFYNTIAKNFKLFFTKCVLTQFTF